MAAPVCPDGSVEHRHDGLGVYLQNRQLDEPAYLLEWLIVGMGLYIMYLGCILQSAIIVHGWNLSAAGIRRLREAG
jgi:hypothetical protein